MRILITGAAGLIGRAAATYLRERGWEVHPIDLLPAADADDPAYHVCDITDFAALREQIRGCDAVVHMAAIRTPLQAPGHEVFLNNTLGTFNVFETAAQAGIRRVVQASSINALGCAYNTVDFHPQYFPIDEDHPLYTTDPYSFSKQQVEEIGAYFWRRERISSVALRYPGVYRPEYGTSPQYRQRRDAMCQFLDRFAALPEAEQQRSLAAVRQRCLAFRAGKNMEYPNPWPTDPSEGIDEQLWRAYTFDRFNLWAFLDVRDAVQAIEKALTADFEGSHSLFINDTHNMLDYDSRALARWFFPEVGTWKQLVAGAEALVSIARARALIGFVPEYSLYGETND